LITNAASSIRYVIVWQTFSLLHLPHFYNEKNPRGKR
jgi:hypothetical protein